jgi:hypothetical protein
MKTKKIRVFTQGHWRCCRIQQRGQLKYGKTEYIIVDMDKIDGLIKALKLAKKLLNKRFPTEQPN